MDDVLPPDPRVPQILPPTAVVKVSPAQLWSAAAQNIAAIIVVGFLMNSGKVGEEFGLLTIAAISGIDLVGRLKAKVSPAAAMALGSTGLLSRLPHLLVALAIAAGIIGGQ